MDGAPFVKARVLGSGCGKLIASPLRTTGQPLRRAMLTWCFQPEIMVRSYRGTAPRIAASAYIDPSAQVIGDVNSIRRTPVRYVRYRQHNKVEEQS